MRSLGLIFLVFLFGNSLGFYQDELARNVLWPLSVAAFNPHVEGCIGNTIGKDFEFGAQITLQCDNASINNTCSGYTLASHHFKAIFLVFRGSISDPQVIEQAKYTSTNPMATFKAGGHVNGYFYRGLNILWNGGLEIAFKKLTLKYPSYSIFVTGHSLGAGMASLAATKIASELKAVPSPPQLVLYTFGQPRTGDLEYTSVIKSLIPEAYRVVHHYDIVSQLPEQGQYGGYLHHGQEVWYNNDMSLGSTFKVCIEGENDECSNGVPAKNRTWTDHEVYFQVSHKVGYTQCVKINQG